MTSWLASHSDTPLPRTHADKPAKTASEKVNGLLTSAAFHLELLVRGLKFQFPVWFFSTLFPVMSASPLEAAVSLQRARKHKKKRQRLPGAAPRPGRHSNIRTQDGVRAGPTRVRPGSHQGPTKVPPGSHQGPTKSQQVPTDLIKKPLRRTEATEPQTETF